MRRVQFIELHEQPWFPSSLRDQTTDALQFGLNLFKAYAPMVPLIRRVIDSARSPSIVDMCSRGGGPWLELSRELQGNAPALHIWLTDKYPNLRAFQNARAASENHIAFYLDSVDAMRIPSDLRGFRTMFSSFHHFSPEEGRTILQNAVDARQCIGIFEVTRRGPLNSGYPGPTVGRHEFAAQQLFGSGVKLRPGQNIEYIITDSESSVPNDRVRAFALWEGWFGYDWKKYAAMLREAFEPFVQCALKAVDIKCLNEPFSEEELQRFPLFPPLALFRS